MFCFAKLSKYDFGIFRVIGPGLGNLLFPWARSIVATRKYGLIPIWPTWPQIKIGPLLRQERDKRTYRNLFTPAGDYISGIKKVFLLVTCPHISEEILQNDRTKLSDSQIVIFAEDKNYFQDILKDHALVRKELLRIVRKNHKGGLAQDWRNSISVHVRFADFAVLPNQDLSCIKSGKFNYRIPISWYVSVVKALHHKLSGHRKVYVFSDGSDDELSELLALPDCVRCGFTSSIGDMIGLSRASILVASGSTFSMWASYLGRMPVVWHPGQLRQRLYYENSNTEIEFDPSKQQLPDMFIKACQS